MFLKNRALVATVFSTIFALGFVSTGTSVKAHDIPRKLSCTNRTLQGDYASQVSGFQKPGATPFNLLFLDRFDGNGNIQGIKGATSTGGKVAQDLSDTSTYQVNSDCTVTLSFQNKFKYFGVIVNNGKKVLILETDSGTNISGVLEKVDY
ncbi:MAG: hypothetical protein RM368_13800 [Nostoc sp. DedSLP03]|uniref:hypothetical protein n=1 Tax=Nostoc sp. DedSLP03 TaxID=3075400 RepID=UPI002AD3C1C9|nr:hypothetical protein [Nostoc sp. DedSLP03]MDZ7966031.1 hypothetical protein [Nostoc sp. DedSLP03]